MTWPVGWTEEVRQKLLQPFDDGVVQWREGKFAYVEARDVMSRLDEVVGPGNWHFHCELMHAEPGEAAVKGSLTVLGVTREDVGEHKRSGPNDRIEVYKAAVSDALKRCAVHFGIARYLYELETARAGRMTEAEANAAAQRAGYAPEQPMGYECETCGAEVDHQIAGASRRAFNGRVFCVKHGLEMKEGMKAQGATACKLCGLIVTENVANASLQGVGEIRCINCQQKQKALEKVAVAAG